MNRPAHRASDRQRSPTRGDASASEPDASRAGLTREARHRLCRLAFRFLWNRDDAEDAVQDALLSAHARRDQLKDDTKWWGWLCRIVVQRCHLHGRRQKRVPKTQSEAALEWHADSAPAEAPWALSETTGAVRDVLLRLPQRQREVIVLRFLEGMSYDEIAAILEIAPSTTRVHARAGLERLRELMSESHPTWFPTPAGSMETPDDA